MSSLFVFFARVIALTCGLLWCIVGFVVLLLGFLVLSLRSSFACGMSSHGSFFIPLYCFSGHIFARILFASVMSSHSQTHYNKRAGILHNQSGL